MHARIAITVLLCLPVGCMQSEPVTQQASPPLSPAPHALAAVDIADVEYDSSPVVVEGVVTPDDQGGWPTEHDYDVHCLSFVVWRHLDGPLVEKELLVLRPVEPDSDYFDDFNGRQQLRCRVLLSKDETRAVFDELLADDVNDAELAKSADKLLAPIIVTTDSYGDLVLDRQIDQFEGKAEWNGREVRVWFEASEGSQLKKAISTADTLWRDEAGWSKRVGDFAVTELLPLKNDNWFDEGEARVSATEFKKRMKLTSISVSPDGSFEFWHKDGDLFYGHSIQISGDLIQGPTDADIPG